jgi:hypothetical protein
MVLTIFSSGDVTSAIGKTIGLAPSQSCQAAAVKLSVSLCMQVFYMTRKLYTNNRQCSKISDFVAVLRD